MSLPVRAALLIFLSGFVALWLFGSDLCPLAVDTDPALLPPGATVCEYERPNTGGRFEDTIVPVGWWFAFAATGVAGAIALAITRRPG